MSTVPVDNVSENLFYQRLTLIKKAYFKSTAHEKKNVG